jgi:cyclopropane fatty-acyl-phospholipid synthase-like methyltransferase
MKDNVGNNSMHRGEGHSHKAFDNPEMFAKRFDAPERDEWQKPDEVIKSLNLPADAVVVEIGAGTGYFAVRLAEHLKNGKVITFDDAPEMAAYLKKRVEDSGLTNIDVRLSEKGGNINLEEKAALIMCVDAYHHIAERIAYFSHLAPHLDHDGKLVIIDRAASAPVGPPPAARTPPELVTKEMEQAGFELVQELDFLLPYQFYLAFRLADSNKK